jgi:AcrB/AcrD/AcrF family
MTSLDAALEGGRSRLRPIVMTTLVMVSGMLPMAFGAAQTAPLAIAVAEYERETSSRSFPRPSWIPERPRLGPTSPPPRRASPKRKHASPPP